jgi:hypothetical protein
MNGSVFVLVPITGIIFGVGLVMLVIYLDHRRRSDALKHAHEERLAALAKGIELPPPPVPPIGSSIPGVPPAGPDRLLWIGATLGRQRTGGLTMLLVGAAIMVAMWETGNVYFWWGLVPAAIGLATLATALIDLKNFGEAMRRAEGDAQPPAARQNGQPPGS